jgi:hypothetical protein
MAPTYFLSHSKLQSNVSRFFFLLISSIKNTFVFKLSAREIQLKLITKDSHMTQQQQQQTARKCDNFITSERLAA